MSKKKLISLALVVIMIAILSFSSLAWFTDKDSIENEFLIADSDDDTADEIFSVDVWETKDDGTKEQTGLTYADILPGAQLDKDPTVENTGYYDQYIRVTVTVSDAAAWIGVLGDTYDPINLLEGFDAAKWDHISNNLQGATTVPQDLVYVMHYNGILKAGETVQVFTGVNIPETMTQEQAAAFAGGFTITVKADAVQTENVVDTTGSAADIAHATFTKLGI